MTSTLTSDSGKSYVLHVDPSLLALNRIQEELTACGNRSIEIASFQEPDKAARHILYGTDIYLDLAILEARLEGEISTFEFIALLRDCHPDCPVILTRDPDTRLESGLTELSGVQVLEKPFRAEDLRSVAERFLKCDRTSE